MQNLPVSIGYQTSDLICFTRNSREAMDSIPVTDWLELNQTALYSDYQIFDDTEFQIFIHRTGYLLRSSDVRSFRFIFFELKWVSHLEFRLSQITVLRKRADANIPCKNRMHDDERQMQIEVVNSIGCTPSY